MGYTDVDMAMGPALAEKKSRYGGDGACSSWKEMAAEVACRRREVEVPFFVTRKESRYPMF